MLGTGKQEMKDTRSLPWRGPQLSQGGSLAPDNGSEELLAGELGFLVTPLCVPVTLSLCLPWARAARPGPGGVSLDGGSLAWAGTLYPDDEFPVRLERPELCWE